MEDGPSAELDWNGWRGTLELLSANPPPPAQFQLVALCELPGPRGRVFRDLAVNKVANALMQHMIGYRAARFSSHNAFIKWKGGGLLRACVSVCFACAERIEQLGVWQPASERASERDSLYSLDA